MTRALRNISASVEKRLLNLARQSGEDFQFAEKFEAIVNLGLTNSRIKDYYDIWLLSQQFEFDGANLV